MTGLVLVTPDLSYVWTLTIGNAYIYYEVSVHQGGEEGGTSLAHIFLFHILCELRGGHPENIYKIWT